MKTPLAFVLVAGLCASATPSSAQSAGRNIRVEIHTDDGHALALYPVASRGIDTRVYAEAVQGQRYRIAVHNHQNRRVGLVIAVDGRNIISGQKSWLRNNERMYVLGPYESQSYEGWRTTADRVNRFFFTDSAASYAAAFGDESAMGLISVATYAEVRPVEIRRWQPPHRWFGGRGRDEGSGSHEGERDDAPSAKSGGGPPPSLSPSAPRMEKSAPRDLAESRAGTGYGPQTHSPSYTVAFEPEGSPMEKTLIKYEWRETLLRLGVLRRPPEPPRTRLWDEGYAPPPPRGW